MQTPEGQVPDWSVVIPVSERFETLAEAVRRQIEAVRESGRSFEVVVVLDGTDPRPLEQVKRLDLDGVDLRVYRLNRWFGEATALAVGFEHARAANILTLPAYLQVRPEAIPGLLDEFDRGESDVLIGRRHPRTDSFLNRLQSSVFHAIARFATGMRYDDLSSGVRCLRREVADEVTLYGDLHRFLPLLAYQKGFKVVETPVPQSRADSGVRLRGPGVYLRRLLDLLTLFFLFKFTKKPLRFFGLVGSGVGLSGAAILGYLGVYRLLGMGGIAGRPLLLLGALLAVLGVQLFSIGLLGEILIFTHARNIKDYQFRKLDTTSE